jgi:hypothetical protein
MMEELNKILYPLLKRARVIERPDFQMTTTSAPYEIWVTNYQLESDILTDNWASFSKVGLGATLENAITDTYLKLKLNHGNSN